MKDFASRLRHAFDGADNKTIAARLGVTPAAVSNYFNGRTPDAEKLLVIAESTNCNLHWLLTGEDQPIRERIVERKVSDPIINRDTLKELIREVMREEIHVQDLGTVDEVLARSLEKDDNPGTALEALYVRNGWDVQELSVPLFDGWDQMTLEQKVKELKTFVEIDERHQERQRWSYPQS